MTFIAVELAQRLKAIKFKDLPEEAIYWAKVAFADTIACTLAGAHEDCTNALDGALEMDRTQGKSLVFGRGRRAGALEATLVNGVASHALDFDDINKSMGGHPSVTLVPPLLVVPMLLKRSSPAMSSNVNSPVPLIFIITKKAGTRQRQLVPLALPLHPAYYLA
jgi:2-methylcitrate dehydratase PrpD